MVRKWPLDLQHLLRNRHRIIGAGFGKQRKWTGAIRYYRLHLAKKPDDFAIWVQLGHALKEACDARGAEEAYARASKFEPENADLALNRGHLAKIQGKMMEAALFYQQSFSIDGNGHAKQELSQPVISSQLDYFTASIFASLENSASDALETETSASPRIRLPAAALHAPRTVGNMQSTRVIAIADATASTELCVQLPLQYMAQHLGVDYSIYDAASLPTREVWKSADLILLMRSFSRECTDLVRDAKEDGIPIVYMTDDDMESLLISKPGSPEIACLIEHMKAVGAQENIQELVRQSDLTIVFSESLQNKFSKLGKIRTAPAPAGIELYDALADVCRADRETSEIRIGFAGSLSHGRDVSIVIPALKLLLAKYPGRVVVESIGQKIEELSTHPSYRHFDHVVGMKDYTLLMHQRSWDIGLAPLEITPFNQAKSDNKYRSYGAAGVAGVYTRIAPYLPLQDGQTALLVENNDAAWFAALERLITDSALRKRISSAAMKDVRERYGIEPIALLYRRIFLEAASGVSVLVAGHLHLASVHIDLRRPFIELRRRGVLRYRLREILEVYDDDLDWAEVLVVVRAGEPATVELMRKAQARGIKVIFSWDDDFFSIPKEHAELYEFYNSPSVRLSLETMLREADLVKASTPRLATVSRQYTDRVITARAGFDFSLLPVSLDQRSDRRIRIGYFGSVGRGSEFACVVEALKRISEEFHDVDFEFFGFAPKDWTSLPRVSFFPFNSDYEASILALAERQWDIALAPLGMNDLNRAKNPTKYRDYGATRAAGVYSDIEPYRAAVRDGQTGLFAENTSDDWYMAIRRLVCDADLREKIAQAAYEDVLSNHGLEVGLNAWKDALRRVGKPVARVF